MLTLVFTISSQKQQVDSSLYLKKSITGKISPKSVVHNGYGVFFAQNMMYRHTVTIYNRSYELVKTLKDQITPKNFGFDEYLSKLKGGPVECAFSHDGKYAWVSNYSMSGGSQDQFVNPGCDNCSSSSKYDSSFVYKVDAYTHEILAVVKVGAVPKYIACTPDNSKVVVTNWSSGDVSIIDILLGKEVKRIKIGTFPRGIVIDSESKYAYVTVMGSTKIAKINLSDYSHTFFNDVGKGPRHLCISPDNNWLYLTLNSENKLAKINLATGYVSKVRVGHQPRSMTMSKDGNFLYVVNYNDNTFSKVRTSDLIVVAISPTKKKPIGITYDDKEKQVWVACYSGYIQIFQDSLIKSTVKYNQDAAVENLQLIADVSDAHVANLSQKVDSAIVADSLMEDEIAKVVVENRKFIGIVKTYEVAWKKFDLSKFEKQEIIENVTQEVATNTDEVNTETVSTNSEQVLDNTKKCLVIVGGFGEVKNAQKKIKQLAKIDILGEILYNPENGLTYVFVYASNTRAEAENWVANNLNTSIESWVKVRD